MSLAVYDGRSRGRSKSPGRRDERSRSRDHRAPSPSSKSKKSSQKYYSDEESESDSRAKTKNSKKYYEDDSSDSGGRSQKKSSKKYHDDESSDSEDRHKKKSSRKRYGEEEDDESSSSESGIDRRSRHKPSQSKHDVADPKRRRGLSPDTHSKAVGRKGEYTQSSKAQYERDRREDRLASRESPDRHERSRPGEYTRHLSYSSNEGSGHDRSRHGIPGQYKWEYDHEPEEHERGYHVPPSSGPEQIRHLSLSNVNYPGGHQSFYNDHSTPAAYGQPQYGYPSSATRPENQKNHSGSLSSKDHYQYGDSSHQLSYASKTDARRPSYTQTARPQFVEAKPHSEALHASGLGQKLQRLSISGGAAGALSLAAPGQNHTYIQSGHPPGSPLLESYHGTYQSISPIPSPLMLPSNVDDDISDLDKDSSDDSQGLITTKKSTKKRVSFYDPEPDALALAAALKHTKPDPGPIIEVLPRLSDDHILELRTEYKKHIKVGGKGINIAKHIKMKVTGNLGKIAYAVALGRWESEAHWANFWYQSNTSRRELLIESLMGRTNSEIVKIKDAFSDKRYDDSLEKCMQTELKKDKFRNAVLLALEEKRMPEKQKLSIDLVRRDVQDLYKALISKEGGETAMIDIIVVRSDNHLREVLRVFEGTYKKNFAREMIKKSQNLVVSSFRVLF